MKPWVQVYWVFLVVVFLLKLYHTRKPVHISTVLWFHSKIAGILRTKSIPTGFVVVVYLQLIKCNQLLSDKKDQFRWPINGFCCFSGLTERLRTREICHLEERKRRIISSVMESNVYERELKKRKNETEYWGGHRRTNLHLPNAQNNAIGTKSWLITTQI